MKLVRFYPDGHWTRLTIADAGPRGGKRFVVGRGHLRANICNSMWDKDIAIFGGCLYKSEREARKAFAHDHRAALGSIP